MATTSRSELDHLTAQIREAVERWQLHGSCLSCHHFTEAEEACAMAGGGRPPARVLVTGCPAYEEKAPF